MSIIVCGQFAILGRWGRLIGMGKCLRCEETVEDVALLDHIRVMHPGDYGEGPERWTDGQIVVIDTEPSMADLERGDR